MVKFTLTEEQIADVLSASQQISGYVRSIENTIATAVPIPVSEPSFEQALQVVLSHPEFIDYIKEQVEEIVENFDADDLCTLEVDEYGREVRITLERKWSAPEAIAQNVREILQDFTKEHSHYREELLRRCRPDEEEKQEEA